MIVLRRPLLWCAMLAMWLVLNNSISPGNVLLGIIVATIACWAAAPVLPQRSRIKKLGVAAALLGIVVVDVVKSNLAVLGLVVTGRRPRSALVEIPLELTDENGLALLACIVTATPGSAWVQHDSRRNVVTIHVLDSADELAWAADFKRTYERRLVEILQ